MLIRLRQDCSRNSFAVLGERIHTGRFPSGAPTRTEEAEGAAVCARVGSALAHPIIPSKPIKQYLPKNITLLRGVCWFFYTLFAQKHNKNHFWCIHKLAFYGRHSYSGALEVFMKNTHPYLVPILILHGVIAATGLFLLISLAAGHPLRASLSTGILAILLAVRVCVESGYRYYGRSYDHGRSFIDPHRETPPDPRIAGESANDSSGVNISQLG